MLMQDPDAAVIAVFLNMARKNDAKSLAAGRPIYEDFEACQLRYAGSKNTGFYPATAISQWRNDPETGETVAVTYAERFPRQYRQFKEHATQTKSGTPVAHAPFLTEARRAELRALNIYTVEALAAVDGNELKNLGPGGRDLKNQAIAWIEEARRGVPSAELMAQLEAIQARNAALEEDNRLLRNKVPEPDEDRFDDMSLEQLRDYIATSTGHPPQGALNKRTLVRMARNLGAENAA